MKSGFFNNGFFIILFLSLIIPITIIRIWQTFLIKGRKKGVRKEGWTFAAAILGYYSSLLVAMAELFFLGRKIDYTVTTVGLIVGFLGFFLTLAAIRGLGTNWSLAIEIKESGTIVKQGPYRFIRHPYYLGVCLELLGFTLFLNSYYTLLYMVIFPLPLLVWRAVLEEKVMLREYKNAYQSYRTEVGSLMPLIFKK